MSDASSAFAARDLSDRLAQPKPMRPPESVGWAGKQPDGSVKTRPDHGQHHVGAALIHRGLLQVAVGGGWEGLRADGPTAATESR